MKRVITLIITAILITISVSGLSACNKNGDSGNNKNAEVTLLKLSAGASSNARYKRNKSAYSTENADLTPNSSNDENDLEFPKDSYTIIYKSQTEINFDILLNNPKNYYIMDFKLTCDDEQIYYYDDKMDKWNCINDIWIRWSGSNNQESRYRLRLPNPEVSPDKIRVSEMYYSDRTDGTNKTAVNMNNKETYRVYKVEDELLTTKTVENTLSAYRFEVIKKEGVVITSIRDDENNIDLTADSDGTYKMEKDGRIRIEYKQNLGDIEYKKVYEKDIELLHIERLYKKMELDGYATFTGNDVPLVAIVGNCGSTFITFTLKGTDINFNNRLYYKGQESKEPFITPNYIAYNFNEMYIGSYEDGSPEYRAAQNEFYMELKVFIYQKYIALSSICGDALLID